MGTRWLSPAKQQGNPDGLRAQEFTYNHRRFTGVASFTLGGQPGGGGGGGEGGIAPFTGGVLKGRDKEVSRVKTDS